MSDIDVDELDDIDDEEDCNTPPVVEDEDEIAREDPRIREQKRLLKKPSIDHLVDAVATLEDGSLIFIPDVRERVIIERTASMLSNRPWLDTRIYTVLQIDDETGNLKLWDDEFRQFAYSNFITGTRDHGYRFRLLPPKGNPFRKQRRSRRGSRVTEEPLVKEPKKRGRPRKVVT